ncbi:MAG: PAS domain S-box protein [Vicinamibacteria bacterium]|nr:PAS domain S-box protein [Vicinamibacteria bacterium]
MDVLLLDQDPGRASLIVGAFAESGDSVQIDDGQDHARLKRLVAERPPDLLVVSWPPGAGAGALIASSPNSIPMLFLADHDEEVPRASFAQEQLSLSGGDLRRLPRAAERVTRAWRLMAKLRQAAEALHESEERLRMVADFTSDWEYWIGPDGRFLYVSPACARITGHAASDLMADPGLMTRIIHPDDRRAFVEHMSRVMNGSPKNCRMDLRIVCRDGETRWIAHSCRAVHHDSGAWWGRRGSNHDITERKRSEAELARLSAELRGLAAHLQTVREDERRRIAQGIHDELGQALTALKMDAAWLERRLSAGDPALADKARDMIDLIGLTLQSVKRLSLELRPRLLDDLGLPAALEWQTGEFARHTGIQCALRVRPDDLDLPRELSTAVFRIVQEALTNVARHAHATRVEVALALAGGRLGLLIDDDGRGIRGEALRDPASFGLMQMRERAIACGGDLAIEGRPDRGTSIRVNVPFTPERPR